MSSVGRRTGMAVLVTALLTAGQGAHAMPLAASARALPTAHLVTLLTGERVLVRTADGRSTAAVIRSSQQGAGSALTTLTLNGDHYVIPATARPYLGRYLDLGLFDVTRLAASGSEDRTALRLTFKPGTTPSLPGVTITSARNGVATGYVTPRSARTFGAALASQAVADSQAGWPAKSALFGSVTGIAPASAAASAVVPNYPQVTLIIHATSHTGAPVPFGFGILMNADDAAKYEAGVLILNGEARVSLPLGHYMGLFDEFTFTKTGNFDIRIMPVSDYTVSGDGQTLSVDARNATVMPTVTTPQPAAAEDLSIDFEAADAAGDGGFGSSYDVGLPGARLLLAPDAPPSVGTFTETTRWILVDPSTPGGRYSYDASFTDNGVPADQSHTVPSAAHLATIHESYASDRLLRVGAVARFVLLPDQFFAFADYLPVPMPLSRTDYVLAPAGALVEDSVATDLSAWDPGIMDEDVQSADPGSVRSESWLRSPYTFTVPTPTPADQFPACFACRSATGMTFVEFPVDGVPTHMGEGFSSPGGAPVAHFSVYRNGALLLSETDSFGDIFEVPKGPGTYRVIHSLNRRFTGSTLSTLINTDVTFVSSGQTGNEMPASWFCFTARKCRVLPVLQAFLNLHATSRGTLPVGTSTFDLSVGHIAGAADTAIAHVSVAVERAGGTVWTQLPVTSLGAGKYRVTFTAHSILDGQAVNVRVSATDADGGVLRQTTTRAFLVSS